MPYSGSLSKLLSNVVLPGYLLTDEKRIIGPWNKMGQLETPEQLKMQELSAKVYTHSYFLISPGDFFFCIYYNINDSSFHPHLSAGVTPIGHNRVKWLLFQSCSLFVSSFAFEFS